MGKDNDAQNLLSCCGNLEDNAVGMEATEAWLVKFLSEVRKPTKDSTLVIPRDILNLESVVSEQLGQLLY